MSNQARKRSLSQALNTGVRKYGTAIVSNLAIAIKTTQLYSFEHQNVVDALRELEEFIKSFVSLEGEAELSRIEDFLFINEVRIKVDLGGIQTYDFILQSLKDREIGCISFTKEPTNEELKKLVHLLLKPVSNPEEPWKSFEVALKGAGLKEIKVSKYEQKFDERQEITDDKRMLAISLFFRSIQYFKDAIDAIEHNRKINLKRLKRVIQAMVDMALDDEPTLLALVNIKDHGSRLANHCVNVAILSVALGAKLGFSKKLLGDLGISALLHDLGKIRVPGELLRQKRESLEGEDRRQVEDHVYNGVEILLNQRIVDAVVKSMNVAFLHHFRFDSTGFPRTHMVKAQNFYSRITAVCDFYDNETAPPPTGGEPRSADQVMMEMMDRAGTEFDPLVVKAFINLLGLYPVGCLVCLDTGELATVVQPATNQRYLHRPVVRLFSDADGNTLDEVVNLMDRKGGGFRRSILKLYQQQEVELEMEEYLSVI